MSSYFGAVVGHQEGSEGRKDNDFYPTPGLAVKALSSKIVIPKTLWEPAAGRGHMAAELRKHGHTVVASDLNDYENKVSGVLSGIDFFESFLPSGVTGILTNPPYKDKMAEKFVLKMLSHDVDFVAVFCRMQFMNSGGRYDSIFSRQPPTHVFAMAQRINCTEEAADSPYYKDHIGGMLEYCWYVWADWKHKDYQTILQWINLKELI
jgi:hypothetical protein